ncbi:DUF4303 domain-containing protein [Undibacterium sp. Di24W]|uniref:DUF4303 domain-containing protein n=1 Tax=Undibacterium sp. Di24W TaxID=3413033 RepID=UPI003BF435B7
MNLESFKKSLNTSLADACKQCLSLLKTELADETIYAFSIYASSGFVTLGVAVSTQESLHKRNLLTPANEVEKFVHMMDASEWKYVNCHHELFDSVNQSIDDYYDCLFDGEFEDHDFPENVTTAELTKFTNDIFTEALVNVLREMKRNNCFVGSNFVSDLLLGLQFGGPSASGIDVMEAVSAQLNSRMWHEKVVQNCSFYRTGLPNQI